MTDRWAARFPHASLHNALPLRLRPRIKVCDNGDWLWLKGDGHFEEIDPLLRRIAGVTRYSVASDESITQIGRRIPEGRLPGGPWNAFASIAHLRPQPAALPATVQSKIKLRLVRAQNVGWAVPTAPTLVGNAHPTLGIAFDAHAMLIIIAAWLEYAATAPLVRLNPLRFATRADGQTLILGSPLPPLNGSYFVNLAGLLIPSGYTFDIPLEPQILRRLLNLSAQDLALFNLDGSYELIPNESLVKTSRSAARLTAAGFAETAGTP